MKWLGKIREFYWTAETGRRGEIFYGTLITQIFYD